MAERPHPGFKTWVCVSCDKEWQVAIDATYPTHICNCGSQMYRPKAIHEAVGKLRADVDELREAISG